MKHYKAGKLKSTAGLFMGKNVDYNYFLPSTINHDFDLGNKKILIYLEEANRLLGELNAHGTLIPVQSLLIEW